MTIERLRDLLAEFDGLDGAVIQSIDFQNQSDVQGRQVRIVLKAFSSFQGMAEKSWKLISITASDHVLFGWMEFSKNTNLVINYPVDVIVDNDCLIIDLDPLHQIDRSCGVNLSHFFIGGRTLDVSVSVTAGEK